MTLTKKQRAEVVELLRCGADVGTLTHAGVVPRLGTVEWQAWEAKRAVQADETLPPWYRHPARFGGRAEEQRYRWLLLEAAQRVEEGTWP